MADSSMFITIAMLVAAFDIRKAKDEHGNDIEPDCEYQGFSRYELGEFCSLVKRRSNIFLVTQRLSNAQSRPAQRRQRNSSALYFMTYRSRKETPMYSKACEGGGQESGGEDEREPLLIRDRGNR